MANQTTFCANIKCHFFNYLFSRSEGSTIMIVNEKDPYKRLEVHRHAYNVNGRTVLLCDTCNNAIKMVAGKS